ncbi:MAG: hypothetical protein MJ237_04200 [bacterium]|nr:hypothetical protein [bacterium]
MRIFFSILAFLLVLSTAFIAIDRPVIHKNVIIFNSDYNLEINEQPQIETETFETVKELPLTENPKIEAENRVISTATKSEMVRNVSKPAIKTVPNLVSTIKKDISPTKQVTQVQNVSTTTQVAPKSVTTIAEDVVVDRPVKQVTKVVPQAVQQQTSTTKKAQRTLTEAEEQIAWNVWRSNLQNKIMQDVRLPIIPTGTVFKFKFSVDRYGKVSNIQTWSENSSYTPYAIQYIAPVIRGYQGKSILEFPMGSNRITTDVSGGWKISHNEKFSTPQDYNDIEKIKK